MFLLAFVIIAIIAFLVLSVFEGWTRSMGAPEGDNVSWRWLLGASIIIGLLGGGIVEGLWQLIRFLIGG